LEIHFIDSPGGCTQATLWITPIVLLVAIETVYGTCTHRGLSLLKQKIDISKAQYLFRRRYFRMLTREQLMLTGVPLGVRNYLRNNMTGPECYSGVLQIGRVLLTVIFA
jgi:hypothetical protein